MSKQNPFICRKCGKGVHDIKGYLTRVNEKGVPGIWECRPSCEADLSPDDRVIAAIEGESEHRVCSGL